MESKKFCCRVLCVGPLVDLIADVGVLARSGVLRDPSIGNTGLVRLRGIV